MSELSIAHVLSSFAMGGQERVALDLARKQRAAGHRVLAVSLAPAPDGPLASAFHEADVRTATVPKWGPSLDPSLPLRLARTLASESVELVHTHNPHALIYGAPAAAIVRAATVHTKHGINPDGERRQWLRRGASRLVDAYVAVTDSLARVALQRAECEEQRLHVISNGIDVKRFEPSPEARRRVRAQLGISEDTWLVGSVGRLAPEKNYALLLDAVAPMLDPHRQLLLVGDGSEREALTARTAASFRAEFVHFTGARDDVPDLLAALDVFALTSHSEGLPLVLLEAMATRVPVLATAVGGVPDIVDDGVTGYLVAAGDCTGLTRKLAWLSTRPVQAQQVAGCARDMVLRGHSLEGMAQAYESLYWRVLTRAQARPAPRVAAGSG